MKKNIYKILGLSFLLCLWANQIKAQSSYTPGPSTVYICNVDEGATLGGRGGDEYCFRWQPDDFLSASDVRNPLAKPTSNTNYVVTVLDNNLEIVDEQMVHVVIQSFATLEEINIEEAPCCMNGNTALNYSTLNVTTVPEELVGSLVFEPQVAPNPSVYDLELFGVEMNEKVKITATCKNDDDEIMEKTITLDIVNPNYSCSVSESKIGKKGDFDIDDVFSNVKKVTDAIKKAADLKPGSGCNFKLDTSYKVSFKISPECCPGYDGLMNSCIFPKSSIVPSGTISFKLDKCGFTFPLGPDGGLLSQYLVECGLTLSAAVGVTLGGGLYWSCEHQNPDVCINLGLWGSVGMEAFAQALKGFGKVSLGITAKMTMPALELCTNNTGSNSVLSGEFCFDADATVTISALWGGITITNFKQNLYHHCEDYF
jgi:hypothetical protein